MSGRRGGTGCVRPGARIRLFPSTRSITARFGRDRWRPYDVADLVREIGIAGELEGLRTVRLQPEGVPNASDRGLRKAALPGHWAGRPAGGVGRGCMERPPDEATAPFAAAGRPPIPPQPLCSEHPRRNAGPCGSARTGNATPAADGPGVPGRTAPPRPGSGTPSAGGLRLPYPYLHSFNPMTISQYHKLQILDIGVLVMTLVQVSPDLTSETSILNSMRPLHNPLWL